MAGLTKNRLATRIISVRVLFLMIMAFELNLAEQTLYAYAAVPGLEDYLEISGYGVWIVAARWYFLMWLTLAISFVLAGIWFWQRGSNRQWFAVFSRRNKQLSWAGKVALVVFVKHPDKYVCQSDRYCPGPIRKKLDEAPAKLFSVHYRPTRTVSVVRRFISVRNA